MKNMKKQIIARLCVLVAVLAAAVVMAVCDAYFPVDSVPPEPETVPPLVTRGLHNVTANRVAGGEYTLTLELDGEVDSLRKEDISLTAGGIAADTDSWISKDSLDAGEDGKTYVLTIGALVIGTADMPGEITVTLTGRKGDVLLEGSKTVPVTFHGVPIDEIIRLKNISAPVVVPEVGAEVYDFTLTFDQPVTGLQPQHISLTIPETPYCLLSMESLKLKPGSSGDTWVLRINALATRNEELQAEVTVQAGGKTIESGGEKWLLGSDMQPVKFLPSGSPVSLYQGTLDVTYIDGTSGGTMKWNTLKGFVLDGPDQRNEVIYTVRVTDFPDKVYRVGRVDTGALNLNIDVGGDLRWRPAVLGVIPLGTIAELNMIKQDEETLRGNYRLDAELDLLGDLTLPYSGVDLADKEWTPIGNNSSPFTGNFDGGDKQIRSLRITAGTNIGLFGVAAVRSGLPTRISNVKVRGSVTGAGNAGGIVGYAREDVVIDSCQSGVNVRVTGNNAGGIAGLAAVNESDKLTTISNCVTLASASVSANNNAGGIVGTGRRITGCKNDAAVYAAVDNAGGITGTGNYLRVTGSNEFRLYLSIENCGNYGAVNAGRNNAGGIAGSIFAVGKNNYLSIKGCANGSDVTAAEDNAGGILGRFSSGRDCEIRASYSRNHSGVNTIRARNWAGGIVGDGILSVFACYSTSKVVITVSGNEAHKGGIFAKDGDYRALGRINDDRPALVSGEGDLTIRSPCFVAWDAGFKPVWDDINVYAFGGNTGRRHGYQNNGVTETDAGQCSGKVRFPPGGPSFYALSNRGDDLATLCYHTDGTECDNSVGWACEVPEHDGKVRHNIHDPHPGTECPGYTQVNMPNAIAAGTEGWGVSSDGSDGKYWRSIGTSWSGASTQYPKLWWE